MPTQKMKLGKFKTHDYHYKRKVHRDEEKGRTERKKDGSSLPLTVKLSVFNFLKKESDKSCKTDTWG